MTQALGLTAIVVCFNQASTVVESLNSVLKQGVPLKLIVVDDASLDHSVDVITGWLRTHQVPHTFIKHGANMGICRSLNEAVERVETRYVSFLAADDLWMPEKAMRQIAILEQSPASVGVVYSDAYLINAAGRQLPGSLLARFGPQRSDPPPEGDIFLEYLSLSNLVPAVTTTVRREVFDAVGLFDESLVYEDYDFFLRAARVSRFAYSAYVSAKYRLSADSFSSRRRPEIELDTLKIFSKYIREPSPIGPKARSLIGMKIWQNYVGGAPGLSAVSRFYLFRSRHFRVLAVLVLTSLHLDYASRAVGLLLGVRRLLAVRRR